MKEKKLLATIAFAATTALLLAGCASGGETEAGGPVPLTFSTSVDGMQTRTGELTTANLTSMGVFAYFTQKDFADATTTVPNFMNNQKVTKKGNVWTYTPVKYWPENTTTDRISFFAYAPHSTDASASGEGITAITTTGTPLIAYTVPDREENQYDLLVATGLLNRTRTGGALTFTMRHMLTKVEFRVTSSSAITVDDLTLKSIPTAATIHFDKNTGVSTIGVTGTPKDVRARLSGSSIHLPANVETSIASFYLLPANPTQTMRFSYKDGDGSGSEPSTVNTITLPATPEWTTGRHVIYTFKVDSSIGLTITTSIGTDWPSTDTNVGDEEIPIV